MNTTASEAQQWSVSQVSDWLNAQGLGSYATAFADKGIDGIIYNQSAHHSCVTQLSSGDALLKLDRRTVGPFNLSIPHWKKLEFLLHKFKENEENEQKKKQDDERTVILDFTLLTTRCVISNVMLRSPLRS